MPLLLEVSNADANSELAIVLTRRCTASKQGELEQAKTAAGRRLTRSDDVAARSFLLQRVEQELGRSNRRRSTDKPDSRHRGVIRLDVK